jgi:cytoskeletal protein RodZ
MISIWPFNRKKKQEQSVLPQEVQEYYQSTKKERRGTAWLLALGTLVLTIVLATILFFSGRWLYQKLTGNDKQPIPVQNETQNQNSQSGDTNSSSQNTSDDQNNNSQNDIVDAPADGSDKKSRKKQAETPATGPTSPEIPDTGPGPGGLQ